MRVISSQHYTDEAIIARKMAEIEGRETIVLPVIYAGEYDGEQFYILVDGHHRGAAAKALDIKIEYEVKDRSELGYDPDWSFEEALEALWLDGDWYDFDSGQLVF